jgi:hypothetical protein
MHQHEVVPSALEAIDRELAAVHGAAFGAVRRAGYAVAAAPAAARVAVAVVVTLVALGSSR